ncbi:MAG: hypothetical protein ABIQ93_04365, partial [Saprospiraceae bacterium]
MSKILLPLVVLLSMLACKKSDCGPGPTNLDQVIFGVSYAECSGDCSRNYRLTPNELFADDCDYCYANNIGFQTTPLANEKFQIAEPLLASVSSAVLNTPDTIFGCPGCHDEGAYYLEVTKEGVKHVFRWSSDFIDI